MSDPHDPGWWHYELERIRVAQIVAAEQEKGSNYPIEEEINGPKKDTENYDKEGKK